ncbi:NAD(P)-binding protein [Zopfia rhizophila CBS 207.26]|uniref:NAD(P)-binding protein n=1 Tax=Zopfia rhizophila CBS 207.26 TaxID=1314779 RepID=A0A6A6DH62_9PEZI|nr:NAD(P)-binding protein [Zopfia rhizophila CBS 207.26]
MAGLAISDLFNVNGMVFAVTGGGSGLGEWMALALCENGASKIFILGRRGASLLKVAAKAINGNIILIPCDISSQDAAADLLEKQTPFVNAVIANPGLSGTITNIGPRSSDSTIAFIQEQLWNTSLDEARQVMDVNVIGALYTFVAFMELLNAGNTHPGSRGKMGIPANYTAPGMFLTEMTEVNYLNLLEALPIVTSTQSVSKGED